MSMTACTHSPIIYIVDGDPDLSLSAKCLFESKDAHVEIFDDAGQFLESRPAAFSLIKPSFIIRVMPFKVFTA